MQAPKAGLIIGSRCTGECHTERTFRWQACSKRGLGDQKFIVEISEQKIDSALQRAHGVLDDGLLHGKRIRLQNRQTILLEIRRWPLTRIDIEIGSHNEKVIDIGLDDRLSDVRVGIKAEHASGIEESRRFATKAIVHKIDARRLRRGAKITKRRA